MTVTMTSGNKRRSSR